MTEPPDLDRVHALLFLTQAKGCLQRKHFERALESLAEALRLDPQSGEAWMVRAQVHVEMGNYQEALLDVERRLRLEPPEPIALVTRGSLHALLGNAELSVADYSEFLRQQPGSALALRGRARAFGCLRRYDEALADLSEALRAEPASAELWLDRGRIYQEKGSYAAAVADYEKALGLGPDESNSYNQFAWMLAACPEGAYRDGPRAVELARRGCELTNWQDANLLDTLASAYAECGRFDEAVKWVEKSLKLVDGETRTTIARHLQRFRNGQPARFEERSAPEAEGDAG